MKPRMSLLAIVLSGVAVLCSACASTSSSPKGSSAASTAKGKSYTIALVDLSALSGNPYWLTVNCAAQTEAKKLGVKLTIQTPSAGTQAGISSELPAVEAALATKPDAIVMPAIDATGLNPIIHQAISEGIKVVIIDQLPSVLTGVTSAIDYTAEDGGLAMAKALAHATGGQGEADMINLPPGLPTADNFQKGFISGLQPTGLKYKSTLVDSKNSSASTAGLVSAALVADPNLRAFAPLLSPMTDGVIAAVRENNLQGKVKIVSAYVDYPQLTELQSGEIDALIGLPATQISIAGIQQAYFALTNQKTTPRITLPVGTITKQNMNDPSIVPYEYDKSC